MTYRRTPVVEKLTTVEETFWVDLVVRNPLEVEVSLSSLTVTVRDASLTDDDTPQEFIEVEIIEEITLGARDTRTVSVDAASLSHPRD